MSRDRCLNCNEMIELISYSMGPQWMHITPGASFPTTQKGTAWRTCRAPTVATPRPTEGGKQ